MATNSTGLALSAGMAATVLLMGYLLLHAAGLVGVAGAPIKPATVPADTVAAWCGITSRQSSVLLAPSDEATVMVGKSLFTANCAQCHAVSEVVVGPALGGIGQRRPMSWLIPWVQNPSRVLASGDAYAVKLYAKYQRQQMPGFRLTNQEIAAIMKFVEVESQLSSLSTAGEVVSCR